MSVLSKIDFPKFPDLKQLDVKYVGLLALGGLITVRFLFQKTDNLPTVYYPSEKQANFASIAQRAKEGKLPKVFWAKGFYPFDLKSMVVIADFGVLDREKYFAPNACVEINMTWHQFTLFEIVQCNQSLIRECDTWIRCSNQQCIVGAFSCDRATNNCIKDY